MEVTFTQVKNPPMFPYSFKSLRKTDVNGWLTDDVSRQELTDYDLQLLQAKDEQIDEIRAYLLDNGYVLVEKKYNYLMYPTLNDLVNAIETKRYWRNNKSNAAQTVLYKKQIDKNDPKERVVLDIQGEEHVHYQFSPQAIKEFLKTFPVREIQRLKYTDRILGKDGRVVSNNKFAARVFANVEDFDFWYNPPSGNDDSAKVWCGRNPYHENILNKKNELLQKLADTVQLKREQIKLGDGAHHQVHKALEKLMYDDRVVNQLFLPLTTYLGEQQIKKYGGHWKLIEKKQIKTWVPVINFRGHDYDIGRNIILNLLNVESEDFPSISSVLWNGKVRKPS